MGLICRDFLIAYILMVIAYVLLATAIEVMLGIDLGNALNIVPQIVAALIAGQRHGKRTGVRPESRFSWQAAVWMTLISVGLSIMLATGFIIYMGPGDAAPLFDFIQSQVIVVAFIIFLILAVYVLVSRYFFGLGAKQGVAVSPQADADIFR